MEVVSGEARFNQRWREVVFGFDIVAVKLRMN